MSVVFSSFDNSNSNQNGYFRIGSVVLDIPPSDIITDRIINNDRKQVLRGKNEMFTKSGHARWDVTIIWTALIDHSRPNPYEQWEKVQTIVAMFKSAPFVEIENKHVRQIFAEKDPIMAASRLAFGLRQLKIDTHPDIVDGLILTITMTYFNYFPYTQNFGYKDSSGLPTDAYNSPGFLSYLQNWKDTNLVCNYPDFNIQKSDDWKSQLTNEPGKIALNWRRYRSVVALPKNATGTYLDTVPTQPSVYNSKQIDGVPSSNSTSISPKNLSLINTLQSAAAQAATNWLGAVKAAGYDFTVNSGRRRTLDSDPGPGQSQQALYAAYLARGKTGNLVARPGHSKHESGLALDITFQGTAAFNYAQQQANIYGFANTYGSRDLVHWDYTGITNYNNLVIKNPIISQPDANGQTQDLGNLTNLTREMGELITQGWKFDHLIENQAFFYQPEDVTIRDETFSQLPHAEGLYPVQISILFVNNFAQIPLANYQYPTYQHIGPAASLISIQLTSVGTPDSETNEPVHLGLSELTSMSHTMEEQFNELRTSFRSNESLHGMQAVFVENAILNMVGIFGILPEQISTEIIRESANMVQVTFTAHQYENVYEDTPAYKVNGITGSYANALKGIFASGSLNSLSSNEQSNISKVMQFQKDFTNKDKNALGNWLLNAATNKASGDFVSTFTDNPVINLSGSQANDLTSFFAKGPLASKYPILAFRAKAIASSHDITYADFLMFSAANSQSTGGSAALIQSGIFASVDSQITNQNEVVGNLYPQIISILGASDPILSSELQQLVNSPKYKAEFQAAVPSADPSKQNSGHGCYKDLGLGDTLNGQELNPSMYFIDSSSNYEKVMLQKLGNVSQIIANNQSLVNSTGDNKVTATTAVSSDPNKLIQMINAPGYSMSEAFPTFKLFFLEDSNSGIYYMFDNFYSYTTVLEIEIIRAWDKPATAIIRMTNISNLFNHKLYDGTTVGRYERNLNKYEFTGDNSANSNVPDSSSLAQKDPVSGVISNPGEDLREGFDPKVNKRIPLKYFPLQTGSKIQLRFGFSNDPDKLTAVFNGSVTEIEEGEPGEIIISAQSFLLELANVSAVSSNGSATSNTNNWLGLDAAIRNGQAPAYGGRGIFVDGGDAQSVMRKLLSNPAARHFGHFQLNGHAPDKLLMGFKSWQPLVGKTASILGYTNAANIIDNAYDRSGENIMVNNYIDYTGNAQLGRSRSFYDQSDQRLLQGAISPFNYYVESTLDMSLWELIKDVGRRYPGYLLLEKFYGFPYEADSTLVFANPLDWYYTRPALIGDDEVLKEADSNGALYKTWYTSQGQAALTAATNDILKLPYGTFTLGRINLSDASQSYSALQAVDAAIINHLSGPAFGRIFNSSADKALVNTASEILAGVERSYEVYVQQHMNASGNSLNNDRIKPVRKYHFIDNNTIIHNRIKLNDKIYNAIKMVGQESKKTFPLFANTNIPEHHVRMLDVSSRINDVDKNILDPQLGKLVGQSFLKEEVGKMYRGEILLRGVPEIEPMDILILLDPSTGITGPVEVDQVIHSFTQESGYITIVKPRCAVTINETTGAGLTRAFGITMASVIANLSGQNINNVSTNTVSKDSVGLASSLVIANNQTNILSNLTALVVGTGIYFWVDQNYNNNPLVLQPLSRFNRPWLGGLEGFENTGLQGHFDNAFKEWQADEIYPLIDLYKQANKIQ